MKYKILCLLLLVGFSFHAQADQVLSFDPSDQQVEFGGSVNVDLRILGLDDDILTSFDLDIFFDGTILGFESFTFGTGLDVFGFGSINGFTHWGNGEVEVFELSLDFDEDLFPLQPNDFVLGTFTFTGLNPGTSALDIFVWTLDGEWDFDLEVRRVLFADIESGSIEVLEPPDIDDDGVPDHDDVCPATVIPEAVPTSSHGLGRNRWTLDNPDGSFTQGPPQAGKTLSFSITNTAGCSCEQIIAELGLGIGHSKYGCSNSAMMDWVNML
jgi:hypothetical protein